MKVFLVNKHREFSNVNILPLSGQADRDAKRSGSSKFHSKNLRVASRFPKRRANPSGGKVRPIILQDPSVHILQGFDPRCLCPLGIPRPGFNVIGLNCKIACIPRPMPIIFSNAHLSDTCRSGAVYVWGVNKDDSIYLRRSVSKNTPLGNKWTQIPGKLMQLDVSGHEVWGVNAYFDVFRRSGITKDNPVGDGWIHVEGEEMKWVSVSEGKVWALGRDDSIYIRGGFQKGFLEGRIWRKVDGLLVTVSVSGNNVWGTSKDLSVFYREGVSARNPDGDRWKNVPGKGMKQVTVGRDTVWGVDANDKVWIRRGVSSKNRRGEDWVYVGGILKGISTGGKKEVWGVNRNDFVFRRNGVGPGKEIGTSWANLVGRLKHIAVDVCSET